MDQNCFSKQSLYFQSVSTTLYNFFVLGFLLYKFLCMQILLEFEDAKVMGKFEVQGI